MGDLPDVRYNESGVHLKTDKTEIKYTLERPQNLRQRWISVSLIYPVCFEFKMFKGVIIDHKKSEIICIFIFLRS